MAYLRVLVLVIHVAAAATVLGGSLNWGRALKQAAAAGAAAWGVVIADVSGRLALVRITSIVTLLTGVALIFIRGGFSAVSPTFHIALTLMLFATGWVMFFITPAVKALAQAKVGDGSPVNVGKIGMATGVLHTVWLVLLVLMFVG